MRLKLRPSDITVIVDSREKNPLDLGDMKVVRAALVTGDYSLQNRERHCAVERKSIQDLVMSLGHERERFMREVDRLRGMTSKMILVEGSEMDIRKKNFRGNIEIASILSSVVRIEELGVPIHFAHNREYAADILRRFLYLNAQRSWYEHYQMIGDINANQEKSTGKKSQAKSDTQEKSEVLVNGNADKCESLQGTKSDAQGSIPEA